MEEQNSNTLIEDKIKELGDLYARMDKTRELLYMDPLYEMKSFDGKFKLDNVQNVTTNRPAVIVSNLVADLMSAKWQTVVEGVSQRQQHYIETFAGDVLAQIDEQLGVQGSCALFEWVSSHICSRSLIGARFITSIDEDNYSIDCLQLDMRWCPFEFGKKGLDWVANRTFRAWEQIKQDYPNAKIGDGTARNYWGVGDNIEVRDYWNKKTNEVWINNEIAFEQKNPFGHVPFVIIMPATGFMFRDTGYMKHEAEDALFLDVNLFEIESQILSIQQTLGYESIRPPYLKPVEVLDAEPADAPPKAGQVSKVKKGEELVLLPRSDVNRAFMTAHQDIEALIQLGAVTFGDLGSAGLDRPGVWFTAQNEIRNKALQPRLKGLARFREATIRMLHDQYATLAKTAKKEKLSIGSVGKKREHSVKQLGDPKSYFISCNLKTQSKAQDVENLAQASAAKQLGMPMKQILTNIMQVDDPDGVMREMEIEQAKSSNPAFNFATQAIRYVEEAEDIKSGTADDEQNANVKLLFSMLLTRMCVDTLKTQFQAQVPEAPKGGSNALAALIAQGNKSGRSKSQPQEIIK